MPSAMTASNHSRTPRKPQSHEGFAADFPGAAAGPSIDPADVARFAAQAADWWDPKGPFAPLHAFNPARLAVIRRLALERFGRDARSLSPFSGLRLIDIGCGGGLIAEPMRRMGFDVTAIDAAAEGVEAARLHAAEQGLDIAYRAATAEQIEAEAPQGFDVVLALEIVEHVTDPAAFLATCARMVAPGGLMIVATLNRTLTSLALGKVAAEYVLRWVPPGTHDWRQFLRPEEVEAMLASTGLRVEGPFGVSFDPLSGRWSESADAGINYMTAAYRD